MGLLKDQLHLSGGAWDVIDSLNDNFGTLGFAIIGVFVFSWIASVIIYRVKGSTGLASRCRRLVRRLLAMRRPLAQAPLLQRCFRFFGE